jgi:hypothetical protein
MSFQYLLWTLGGLQIWRYRRRVRREMRERDPRGYEALRQGGQTAVT